MKLLVTLLFLLPPQVFSQPLSGCNNYYSGLNSNSNPSSWTRAQVHQLIQSTHVGVPINSAPTRGDGDTFQALMELDAGDAPDTVHLIYANEDIATNPFGGDYWNKEYIWPTSRGLGLNGPDFTDLHNIRPSSKLGRLNRSDKYFSECGVLDHGTGTCTTPAEGGDQTSTCSCNRAYQPPENMRGPIARALLYMDLRYDGEEVDTSNLRLTDCPFQPPNDMAYLSLALTWNSQYPPDDDEKGRNQKVCENWQGNRNPFVDFYTLANTLYPDPLPDPAPGREIYEACEDIPTNAPTLSPNDCDTIEPVALAFFLLNSIDPDELAIYVFEDLPGNLTLYLTDNAWDGSVFRTDEGTWSLATPDNGIPGGTWFGYGSEDLVPKETEWKKEGGIFELSELGEQVFLYCYGVMGNIHHLAALSYNGPFQEPFLEKYRFNESALPESLKESAIVLPHKENYIYNGPKPTDSELLKQNIKDPENWAGGNFRYFLPKGESGAISRTRGSFMAGAVASLLVLLATIM